MKKTIPNLFRKLYILYFLAIIITLCAFFPAPFYHSFTREKITFTANADLMNILKRSSFSQVQNDQAYFYFTDATHYLAFRDLSLNGADSVVIRYRAYPLNRRSLMGRPVLQLQFEDKQAPGTFIEGTGLSGSYRTRTVRTRVPRDTDVQLFISSGLGNIVDQYVLVVEEIRVLNRTRPWWGMMEFLSNYRSFFMMLFSLLLIFFCLRHFKKKKIYLFFLGAIILFHFFNAVPLERMSPYFADAREYQRWGATMLQHGIIGPAETISSTHWPPLWPFTLGILEYFYSDPASIISFMTLIQVGILIFIYLLGARYFSRAAALAAVVLFTLYPETLIRSKIFYSEPLFLLLTMSFLYFYLLFREKRQWPYFVLTLISFLTALHTKQEILVLWGLILPVEFFFRRKNLKYYFLMTLLIIAGSLPYVYRNYRVTGELVFISSTFGQNLLMGNCFRIEELEYGPFNQPYPYGDTRYMPEQLQKIRQAANELEVNALNTRFALEYLREVNIPLHLARKAGLYLFWEGYPYKTHLYLFSVPWLRFVTVLALGLGAFILLLYRKVLPHDILLILAAPVVMNAAIAMIFFLRAERHRYLAMPFLLIFICALVFHLFDKLVQGRNNEERERTVPVSGKPEE